MFRRICLGKLETAGELVPSTGWQNFIKNYDKPNYYSIFKYTEEQKEHFKTFGSVAGVNEVVANHLFWDLDSAEDLSQAKQDVLTLFDRFKAEGIQRDSVQLYFSGKKGFTVLLEIDQDLDPKQIRKTCVNFFGKKLPTLDTGIYNASRILRVPFSKHESGLYKIKLDTSTFKDTSIESILELAAKKPVVTPINSLVVAYKSDWVDNEVEISKLRPSVSLADKPYNWKSCKWNLLQGNFGEKAGERHDALIRLAATCRGLGYDKESTYYLCKGAIKKQAAKTGREEYGKEELWNNIIEQSIFSSTWQGGAYSCKSDPWLSSYCKSLGKDGCGDNDTEDNFIELKGMTTVFNQYAHNFETNIVKTGIHALDENLILLCSSVNGLLGQPGSGKTSASLQILKNASMKGIQSVFFSMDMGLPIIYGKLLQRETGQSLKDMMKLVKSSNKDVLDLIPKIENEFKNVSFNFQSGLVVPDMKKLIKERQQQIGEPVKLVIIDYLECISGPFSDTLANTGLIANQLKDMANELNVCVVLLLQTQKHSTPDVSDPLLTLKGVKGSSVIEQSCSTITSLWREGYSPETIKDDNYISFAIVKNRFGSLWKGDFKWVGKHGLIENLNESEFNRLRQFKEEKAAKKLSQSNGNRLFS